mgnify:CR=1 FL=1
MFNKKAKSLLTLLALAPILSAAPKDIPQQKESDWVDARYAKVKFGPFVSGHIATPKGSTHKGIAIRVGDKGEGTMVFDTDETSGTRMMRYTGSMEALVERFAADDRFRNDVDRCKSAELAADTAISTGVSPGPWRALANRYCQKSQEPS